MFSPYLFIHRKGSKNAKGYLFSEKVLFYSLPSFLPVDIFGGSTAKNKKKHLRVLRACPVALEDSNGVCSSALLNLADLFIRVAPEDGTGVSAVRTV
jgi:hypothetical protein